MVIQNNFQTQLKRGTDNNIVVFDVDAPKGILTKRLIALMKTYGRRNGFLLDRLICEEPLESNCDFVETLALYDMDKTKKFGVNITFTYDKLTEFFTGVLQGSVAKDDEYVIIGICADNKIILGSC